MVINIIFISSYSSQLGALIALINHNKLKSNFKKKHIFIVFQFPTLSDQKCKFSPFEKKILKNYFINFKFFKFRVNNHFKRIILWVLLFTVSPLLWNKNFIIWQNRPDWMKTCFTFKRLILPVILPRKNLYYCGDGFLSLCRSANPFWLKPTNKSDKKLTVDLNEKNTFYYLYSIDYQEPTSYDIKIPINFIKKINLKIIESKTNLKNISLKKKELENKTKSLFIFPTSTFSETLRCSLNEEIDLYLDFINKQIDIKSHFICIKPHPGSSRIKTLTLEKKLLEQGYELFQWGNYDKLGKVYNLPLEIIPLELFIGILVTQMGLKYEKFILVVSSNASLSCLILYPKLNYLIAFSENLINKYLDNKFKMPRLEQEKFIKEFIHKNIKNK